MLLLLDTFYIGREYTYLSTPTTTGPLHFAILEKYEVKDKKDLEKGIWMDEVFWPSVKEGHNAADLLRAATGKNIYCPTEIDILRKNAGIDFEWNQKDYMKLWEHIINNYANEMFFNRGWNYSLGCVREWVMGAENKEAGNINSLWNLSSGHEITGSLFEQQITSAIDDLKQRGFDVSTFESIRENAQDKGLLQ